MAKIESFYNQNLERKVLNPFEVEKRVFYPIIDISIVYSKNIIYSAVIAPIAFVVEENGEKYIIPLTDENSYDDSLFSMISTKDM